MYEITVHEKRYINQDNAQVTVSFQLPSCDWNLLKTSTAWCQVENLLQEFRNKHILMCQKAAEKKLGDSKSEAQKEVV